MDILYDEIQGKEGIQVAEKNSNKQRLIIIMATVFLLGALFGGGWWWYNSSRYVSTDDARVDGTIVGVSSKISGKVIDVLVKEGDEVQAGQIIAKLDTRDIAAQKKKAEAALAVAQANYKKVLAGSRPQEIEEARAGTEQSQAEAARAQANFDDAAKNYERINKLYGDGAISTAQRDDAETAYLTAKDAWAGAQSAAAGSGQKLNLTEAGSRKEDIQAAAAMVEKSKADLEAVNVNDDDMVIVSPVNGVVAMKAVNAGEVVSSGQVLFSIVDYQDLWLNARIKETEIGKLKVEQSVSYTIDGYPGLTFQGNILEIGNATGSTFALIPSENASGNFTKITQRVPIKISLPEAENGVVFRPGMQSLIDIRVK